MQKQLPVWIDVKELRTARGWLQWEAADKLGVTRAHLSAIENKKKGISIKLMTAIIKVFHVKYEDFTIRDQ
ncbi:MAG: helix-turn-helix transcriptional regulator [Defluviitaleaceae bacterium]|nr:helix-turn-helix transcriptional regulator [Defluviitaleaceae bacterium]